MANRFEKALWPDRETQYSDRRRLTATADADIFDIDRIEGEVVESGKAFNKENMEGLEGRIYNAFDTLESGDIKMTDSGNIFTATTVDGALTELFQYAGNGKTAIATAIGSEVTTAYTFPQLATAISNGKLAIANGLGDSSLQTTTFGWLGYMANFYRTEALKKKNVAIITSSIPGGSYGSAAYANLSFDLGFVPSHIFVVGVSLYFKTPSSELSVISFGFSSLLSGGDGSVTNISQTGCTLTATFEGNGQVKFVADQNVTVIGIG